MRSHDDFRDYKNMPNTMLKSTRPKFQLLKNRLRKIVFLIDKSIFKTNSSSINKIEKVKNINLI